MSLIGLHFGKRPQVPIHASATSLTLFTLFTMTGDASVTGDGGAVLLTDSAVHFRSCTVWTRCVSHLRIHLRISDPAFFLSVGWQHSAAWGWRCDAQGTLFLLAVLLVLTCASRREP